MILLLHAEHRTGYSTSFEPAFQTDRRSNCHIGYLLSNWNHRCYCASHATKPWPCLPFFHPCTHLHMARRRRSGWGLVLLARLYRLCGASSVYTDVSISSSSLFYNRMDYRTIHGSPSTPSSSPSTSCNCTMCMSSCFLRSLANRQRSEAFRPCNCTFHSFETQEPDLLHLVPARTSCPDEIASDTRSRWVHCRPGTRVRPRLSVVRSLRPDTPSWGRCEPGRSYR